MTTHEFHQISYKRFKTENEDGSGKLYILDNKTMKAPVSDLTENGVEVRKLYCYLKREMA